MRTVAIIGGGNSGLTCTKTCLEGGLLPTCYEMTDDIGGLWNYDTNAIDGKASVMKSTVINTSKEFMAFSDFPPPADYPNYMHNTKLLSYFRMYAEKFRLRDYVRFRRRVTRIQPADDYEQTGCWMVSTVDAAQSESASKIDVTTERYDAVMLATGHHAHPRWVNFPGSDHFQGQRASARGWDREQLDCSGSKLHSWQYKNPKGFEDKTVLVVGVGNSGGDMVVDLARTAKQVRAKRSLSVELESLRIHA